jgi:two-component system NtrC family sensor kinase
VLSEAQNRVESDLNAAEEMVDAYADRLFDLIRLSADRFYLRNTLLANYAEGALGELIGTMRGEELDFLTLTDADGVVLVRGIPSPLAIMQAGDALVAAVLAGGGPLVAPAVFRRPAGDGEPGRWWRGRCSSGGNPVGPPPRDHGNPAGWSWQLRRCDGLREPRIGVLYGGLLLNRRADIVDLIKETVFAG